MKRRIGFIILIICCEGFEPFRVELTQKRGRVIATYVYPSSPNSTTPIHIKVSALTKKIPKYVWTVNRTKQNTHIPKLKPDHFSKGDTVFCSVLIGGKEKKRIGPIIIGNAKPIVRKVKILPRNPRRGTDLSIDIDVFDHDRDNVKLQILWYINDEIAGIGETLSGSKIKAGDKVYAEVIPFDGTDIGLKGVTNSIKVQNTPPDFIITNISVKCRTMDYELKVMDLDSDAVSLFLSSAPSGMRLIGNRLLWEVPNMEKDTSFLIEIIAKDERKGETLLSFDLRLGRKKIEEE